MKIFKHLCILIFAIFCLCSSADAQEKAERIDTQVILNGREEIFSLYNIDDYSIIRPCDLAIVLKDTKFRFAIASNSDDDSAITIKKGRRYKSEDGVDPMLVGYGDKVKYTSAKLTVTLDKTTTELQSYIIDGNYYVKVRELADLLGYTTLWRDFGSYIEFLSKDGNTMSTLCLLPAISVNEKTVTSDTALTQVEPETAVTTVEQSVSSSATTTTIQQVDPNKPMIALTFDDGPRRGSTERIVEALKKVNGRATFFVVGQQVQKSPDLVKMAVDAGCQIGNHTNTHINLNKLSAYAVKSEIYSCSNAVYAAAGVYPMIGRPPYGSINTTVRNAVNIPWFNWNYDTLDWKNKNSDYVYNTVVNNAKDGQVMLLHDLHITTADGIVRAIPKLKDMGYQLVTIDEMAKAKGGYDKVPGYIKETVK